MLAACPGFALAPMNLGNGSLWGGDQLPLRQLNGLVFGFWHLFAHLSLLALLIPIARYSRWEGKRRLAA